MTQRIICFGLFALFLLAFSVPPKQSASAQGNRPICVIVAASLGASDIPLRTLRHAYEAYPTDFSGARLVPFNLALGTPARTIFDKALLGLSPEKVPLYWIDRKIRQSTDPPRSLPSPELLLRVVASLKGGIGYLEADPATIPNALRVLSVDGRRPTDSDYPLAQ